MVIGVSREGGQRRGEIGGGREEIGKTTNWICTGGRAFPHLWQMCSLASGVESLLSMSNGGRNSVHRLYGLAGPQMASQTVGRTQASDIFRYSDIQIYSDIFSVKKLKRERSWYIGYAPAPPVSVTCHQSPDSSAF